jgi:D-alanine transaminase
METAYLNGSFLPKQDIKISPDDRGFLFGDGIYEVMKWYAGFFYDPQGHLERLRRSMREIRIDWSQSGDFLAVSRELIRANSLDNEHALIYLQVTRGTAPRNHAFPEPAVEPTVYAFARKAGGFKDDPGPAVPVLLTKDIRWSRCDIKSIALLANTISFQNAHEKGMKECIFVRDGFITEGSRSNIFLVADNIIYTYPQSDYILSGITRKNIIRYAGEAGLEVREEPFPETRIHTLQEAFFCNSSSELTPVSSFGDVKIGSGSAGQVTMKIYEQFRADLASLKG